MRGFHSGEGSGGEVKELRFVVSRLRARKKARRRGTESLWVIEKILAIALFGVLLPLSAQSQPQPQQPADGMNGGISSAGTFAPVYDAEKRPITAGGFVDHGPVVFEDVSKASGLASWQHVMGTLQKKYILETDGSGVGLIDYDNDGWLDIYLVNGSTYDALSGKTKPPARRALPQQP